MDIEKLTDEQMQELEQQIDSKKQQIEAEKRVRKQGSLQNSGKIVL